MLLLLLLLRLQAIVSYPRTLFLLLKVVHVQHTLGMAPNYRVDDARCSS